MIAAPSYDRANILLVDDQHSRLLSYQAILDELEQNLVTARSGEEALQRVLEKEFAVIILDVSMPGMDGFETAAMIHEHPRFERTPIIFVTGVHDSEMDRLRGYHLGAVDYVGIPVVPEILRSKVSVLVELHHQRVALQSLNQHLTEVNGRLELANQSLLIEKNRELQALNADLIRSNAELESVNGSLKLEVAERSRAEAALKRADRQKDEFLAVLAHELRNPLAPIRNAVEILRHIEVPDPRFQHVRKVIDRQLTHISKLMDDLLDIARVTRGSIRLDKAPVPVDLVLKRSVETVLPMMSQRRQELTVDCDDPSMRVDGDLTRLVQVVSNIMSNASKYTHEGGHIEVGACRAGQSVEICVRDDGIGLASEDIPRLFSLFSRVDGADGNVQEGLGVGLALVRKLVELHGGNVWVRSAGRGSGSEFYVRLPLCNAVQSLPDSAAPEAADARPTTASLARTAGGVETVLVADDNRDALDTLTMLLEQFGYSVVKAANGLHAIELAKATQPRLMLVDIGMPGADGYEVARQLRGEPWSAGATLIAVSGWGQPQDVDRAIAAGFDCHLIKPINFAVLSKLLEDRHLRPAGVGAIAG